MNVGTIPSTMILECSNFNHPFEESKCDTDIMSHVASKPFLQANPIRLSACSLPKLVIVFKLAKIFKLLQSFQVTTQTCQSFQNRFIEPLVSTTIWKRKSYINVFLNVVWTIKVNPMLILFYTGLLCTLIVPISACFYSELRSAITSNFILSKSSRGCSDIIEHIWLFVVEITFSLNNYSTA